MDRKGFILHHDQQSLAGVRDLHHRGARYFVAEQFQLSAVPGFEQELRSTFRIVRESHGMLLLDLQSDTVTPSSGS